MTLATKVIIEDPAPAKEVFDHCRILIGATDQHVWFETDTKYSENPGFANQAGQGLPALLDVDYGPDGPLRKYECECEEYEDERPCYSCRQPDGFVAVVFDTTYGYRGEAGEGCGDLHAKLVARLGSWLDGRGLSWSWQNEFTLEWHKGYDGLSELVTGGSRASTWFTNEVLPVIQAAGGLR